MRILTTHSETNLNELARRLFNIEGPQATVREKAAVAAIRRANPHLRSGATLPEGAPVVVPDVKGVERAPTPAASFDVAQEGVKEIRSALTSARKVVDDAQDAEKKEEDVAKRILSAHGAKLSSVNDEVKGRITTAKAASTSRAKEYKDRCKLHAQALDHLINTDLKHLADAMGK